MLKNIKRILGIVLATIILLVFTACAGSDDASAQSMEIESAQKINSNNNSTQESDEETEPFTAIHAYLWQEAYAETLQLYATGQNLREWETGWEFALHDVNQDGIPELFLGARQISGHIDYRYVYTFLVGEEMRGGVVRLDFEGFLTDGAIFSHVDNSPWIVAFLAVGSGGRYVKLEMTELGLVPIVDGMASLSDEGHEMEFAHDDFDWQNYEWYNLSIDGIEITAYEFESVFGAHKDRAWLSFHEVSEVNIRNVIFSSEEMLPQYTDEWVTITAGLGGGISISIPSEWQSYEHIPAPGGEPFSRLLVYGEGIGGLIELSIHESPVSLPSMILDEFTYQEQFQFNDGHIGYMAEDYRGFVWIHSERGILDIYFRHDGNRELFTNNEYHILNIVSSLRYTL